MVCYAPGAFCRSWHAMDEANDSPPSQFPSPEPGAPERLTPFLNEAAVGPGGERRSPIFYGPGGMRAGWRLLVFFAILSVLFSAVTVVLRLFLHHRGLSGGITPGLT